MKKIYTLIIIAVIIMLSLGTVVLAIEEKNVMETNTASELIQMKDEAKSDLDKYIEKYEDRSFGTTAYILNAIRLYSIPCCFIGIAIGALYQYVLGTRRLDVKHKGFGLIIAFVTILVICQVLPLIFAIVVKGWRG